MVYKINDIDMGTYGIIPGQAPGSNIAISGQLDMPARIGKTHESWDDHDGSEPYVREGDINLGGRDIVFYGLVSAASKLAALAALKSFFDLISAADGLLELECGFGSWQVYVKDEIEVEYIGNGWCTIVMPFRQPVI